MNYVLANFNFHSFWLKIIKGYKYYWYSSNYSCSKSAMYVKSVHIYLTPHILDHCIIKLLQNTEN